MDWYAQNAKYHNKMTKKAKERKDTPVFSGVLNYFPDAIREVAKVSFNGNEQHNPGSELHWDRSKSGDEKDALTRHLLDAGTRDDDGMLHSAKVAWRALAMLQKELESIEHEQWQNAMISQSQIEDRMYPTREEELELELYGVQRGPCSSHAKQQEEDECDGELGSHPLCCTDYCPCKEDNITNASDLEGSVDADLLEIQREERMRIIGQNGNDGLHYDNEVNTSLSAYPESNWTEDRTFNIMDAKVTIDGGI